MNDKYWIRLEDHKAWAEVDITSVNNNKFEVLFGNGSK